MVRIWVALIFTLIIDNSLLRLVLSKLPRSPNPALLMKIYIFFFANVLPSLMQAFSSDKSQVIISHLVITAVREEAFL